MKGAEKDKKLDLIMGYCKDAYAILEGAPEAADTAALVRRFLREQSETGSDGRTRAKYDVLIRADSLQSAYDADATYHNKAGKKQSGYVLELAKTCADENPYQLIIDYCVERNNVGEAAILKGRIGGIRENTGCVGMWVDEGYNSPELAGAAKKTSVELHTNLSGSRPRTKMPPEAYVIDEETDINPKIPD